MTYLLVFLVAAILAVDLLQLQGLRRVNEWAAREEPNVTEYRDAMLDAELAKYARLAGRERQLVHPVVAGSHAKDHEAGNGYQGKDFAHTRILNGTADSA